MEPSRCKGYNKGIAALKRESSTLGALRSRREGSEVCLFTPEFNLSLRNSISTKTKVLSFQRTRKPAEGRARSRRFSPGADLRTRPMAVPPEKPPPKDSNGLGASAPLPAGGSAGLAPTVRSQKRSGRGKKTAEANARKRRGNDSFRPVHRSLTPSTPSRRPVSSARGPQAPVRLSAAPQRLRPPGGPEDARCVTGPSRWPRVQGGDGLSAPRKAQGGPSAADGGIQSGNGRWTQAAGHAPAVLAHAAGPGQATRRAGRPDRLPPPDSPRRSSSRSRTALVYCAACSISSAVSFTILQPPARRSSACPAAPTSRRSPRAPPGSTNRLSRARAAGHPGCINRGVTPHGLGLGLRLPGSGSGSASDVSRALQHLWLCLRSSRASGALCQQANKV